MISEANQVALHAAGLSYLTFITVGDPAVV
jgi:hypothetical protein